MKMFREYRESEDYWRNMGGAYNHGSNEINYEDPNVAVNNFIHQLRQHGHQEMADVLQKAWADDLLRQRQKRQQWWDS